MSDGAKHYLDITAEICPMTFVKTKLRLEKMSSGDLLELRLKGFEPLRNIPRSVLELGHEILVLEAEAGQGADGIHRLLLRKN